MEPTVESAKRLGDALSDDRTQLAAAREAAGLTLSAMARRLGVSRTAVRSWEHSEVPASRLAAVRAVLEMTPAQDLQVEQEPFSALDQVAALAQAHPGVTERKFRSLARHLALDLPAAQAAGALHLQDATRTATNGRNYSVTLVQPGRAPVQPARLALTGADVAGLRHLHGWSQQGLGRRLGVSRQRVADLERFEPPASSQDKLHAALVEPLTAGFDLPATLSRVDVPQAELARRLGVSAASVTLWKQRGTLPLAQAVRLGQVLAEASRDADPVVAAAERVEELLVAAGPDGLSRDDLQRELSQGRHRRPGNAQTDEKAVQDLQRRRLIHQRETWLRDKAGSWQPSPRWHSGPRQRASDPHTMSGKELAQQRTAAGVSQSQLAAELGTVWGTVSKWERRAAVAPEVTAAARTALARFDAVRVDPLDQARTALLSAATEAAGRTQRQLLETAGYGKANPVGLTALQQLLDDQALHLRPTAKASRVGGWHHGVYPGAGPALHPLPLPGAELARQRQAAGAHQHELADALGLTQTAVAWWERHHVPSFRVPDVLAALAHLDRQPPMPGSELRRARKAAGLTQAALASALGLTAPAITRWERLEVPRNRVAEVNQALSAGSTVDRPR